jgi:hypothetical protein
MPTNKAHEIRQGMCIASKTEGPAPSEFRSTDLLFPGCNQLQKPVDSLIGTYAALICLATLAQDRQNFAGVELVLHARISVSHETHESGRDRVMVHTDGQTRYTWQGTDV